MLALNKKLVSRNLAIATTILFLAVVLFSYINYLPAFWKPIYFFYIALASIVFYLAVKIDQMPETLRENSPIVYLSSHFFLLTLIILAINQFLKREIILDYQVYIIGLSIALGFLTFFAHRERVEVELEQEKHDEEAQEKKRKSEFPDKFPFISKIPLVRSCVKWMYGEGWVYSVGLIAIVIIGFGLRVKLISNSLWIDETYSYLAVKSIINSGLPIFNSGLVYLVSPLFHYLTAILLLINESEVSFRIITLISGLLLIIISYLYFKKYFNKDISLIVALYLSFSTYFITLGVFGRHYALFLFLFILALYLIDNLKPTKKSYIIILLVVILAFLTHVFGFILFIVFLINTFFRKKITIKRFLIYIAVISFLFSTLYLTLPQLQDQGISYLTSTITNNKFDISNYISFYSLENSLLILFLSVLGFFIWIMMVNKSKLNIFLVLILFILIFGFYINNSNFRYSSILFIFSIPFMLYGLKKIVILVYKGKLKIFIFIGLLLLVIFIPWGNIIKLDQSLSYDIPLPNYHKIYGFINNDRSSDNVVIISATWGGSPAKVYLTDDLRYENYIYNDIEGSYSLFSYSKSNKDGLFLKDNIIDNKLRDKYSNYYLINGTDSIKSLELNNRLYFVLDHNRLTTTNQDTLNYLLFSYHIIYDASNEYATLFLKESSIKELNNITLNLENFIFNKDNLYPTYSDIYPKTNNAEILVHLNKGNKYTIYISGIRMDDNILTFSCDEYKLSFNDPNRLYSNIFNILPDKDEVCKITFVKNNVNPPRLSKLIIVSEN